ncbi:MAG TPA: cytochrome c biogenesis protein CcdA [Anaerolineaceae bacterium]|nr:cytochrome c biogenesis protein CcdA [Anaerolineaceae bacterium]
MEAETLTLPLAFLAGLLSFASPCVLPLVPAYLGYLGGTAVLNGGQDAGGRARSRLFTHALMFVLGFMLVFVLLGASATFIGQFLLDYRSLLQRVGSVLLVVFGLRLMAAGWTLRGWLAAAGVVAAVTFVVNAGWLAGEPVRLGADSLRWVGESAMMALIVLAGADLGLNRQIALGAAAGALNLVTGADGFFLRLITSLLIALLVVVLNRAEVFSAEKRFELSHRRKGSLAWSFLFGLVFAAGWTPCIGPILGGILIVASQLGTVTQGILFLAAYSLGLGIPFLLFGLTFGTLSKHLRGMNRYLGVTSTVSGVLLGLMGLLLLTDSLSFLARYGSFFDLSL